MALIEFQVISNIEAVLPVYKVSSSSLVDITVKAEPVIYTYPIELNDSLDTVDNSDEEDELQKELIDDGSIDGALIDMDLLDAYEGTESLVMHLKKERKQSFMKKCKALYALSDENLSCQVCGFSFVKMYGELGRGFIEGHHTVPISELTETTKVNAKDILMVCSNCHRMLHKTNPCLTKEMLRERIHDNSNYID